jgi:hypothetical protein
MLNFPPGEPLALVQELPCFDSSIKLDPLLTSTLHLFFHNLIIVFLLHVVMVDLYWRKLFFYL